jgi:hypothetical protein
MVERGHGGRGQSSSVRDGGEYDGVVSASRVARPDDTSEEAYQQQVARWREMSPAEKAALVAGLYRATQHLADAGIRARHPIASPRERFLRRAILNLGRDLAVQAYPDAADLTP